MYSSLLRVKWQSRQELHKLIYVSRHVCCMQKGKGLLMTQSRQRSAQKREKSRNEILWSLNKENQRYFPAQN